MVDIILVILNKQKFLVNQKMNFLNWCLTCEILSKKKRNYH